MRNVLFVFVFFFMSSVCYADKIYDQTVKSVFSYQNNDAGFTTHEELTDCKYKIMYFKVSTSGGKAQMAKLLTAKVSNWKISRIDFTINSNGACWASGIHVE